LKFLKIRIFPLNPRILPPNQGFPMPTTYTLDLSIAHKDIRSGHLRQGGSSPYGDAIEVNSYYITLNGRPFFGVSGEFQFSRYPAQYWEDELRKIKAAGVNVLATYLFWIHHEPQPGQFHWEGSYDVRRFVQLCQKVGLWVAARIGPLLRCRNGGIPDWLWAAFEVVSTRTTWLTKRHYQEIGCQLSGLGFSQGDHGSPGWITIHAPAPWMLPTALRHPLADTGEGAAI
jgi:hypothetical protein